jgi:transmembrane sensor
MQPHQEPNSSNQPKRLFWDWFTFDKGNTGSKKDNAWQSVAFQPPPASSYETRESEYEQLRRRVEEPAGKRASLSRRRKSIRWQPWYRVAAVVSLLMMVGVVYWRMQYIRMEAFTTHQGETRQLVLPDRSVVYLNAQSRLSFSSNWQTGKTREVWLEGEAFFSVRKQPRPGGDVKFVVHTHDLDVEVLGTAFNVLQRQQRTRVVLQSGKVQLSLHQEQPKILTMKPGELVEYSSREQTLVQKKVNPALYMAWKDQQLILNDQSIRQIAGIIEKTYGIRVIIADSTIADLRLTGKIHSGNVDLLLEALAATHPLTYEKENDRIILRSKQLRSKQ